MGSPPQSKNGRYFVRIRLPNDARRRFWLPPGVSEARARDLAQVMRERVRTNPEKYVVAKRQRRAAGAKPGEVAFSEYVDRWFEDRELRGLASTISDKGRMHKHVLPLLGKLTIASVSKADVRNVVGQLDKKSNTGELKQSSAVKIWGLVTKLFSDACESKTATLRVRVDNPCLGVRGPDRGSKPIKQWLFPTEVTALLSCAEVPTRWRRIYALAVYLYVRPGELAALEWRDVNLERGYISIRRSLDLRTGKVKGMKTGKNGVQSRQVPIPQPLRPLLEVMRREANGLGRLITSDAANRLIAHGMTPIEDLARTLRDHLERAGLRRDELFRNDGGSHPVVFYDLRHTGIMWEVLAGTDHIRIMHRAGHASFTTSLGYVHAVEDFRLDEYESPFPLLPGSLFFGHGDG